MLFFTYFLNLFHQCFDGVYKLFLNKVIDFFLLVKKHNNVSPFPSLKSLFDLLFQLNKLLINLFFLFEAGENRCNNFNIFFLNFIFFFNFLLQKHKQFWSTLLLQTCLPYYFQAFPFWVLVKFIPYFVTLVAKFCSTNTLYVWTPNCFFNCILAFWTFFCIIFYPIYIFLFFFKKLLPSYNVWAHCGGMWLFSAFEAVILPTKTLNGIL